jgi:hypothetical protein
MTDVFRQSTLTCTSGPCSIFFPPLSPLHEQHMTNIFWEIGWDCWRIVFGAKKTRYSGQDADEQKRQVFFLLIFVFTLYTHTHTHTHTFSILPWHRISWPHSSILLRHVFFLKKILGKGRQGSFRARRKKKDYKSTYHMTTYHRPKTKWWTKKKTDIWLFLVFFSQILASTSVDRVQKSDHSWKRRKKKRKKRGKKLPRF